MTLSRTSLCIALTFLSASPTAAATLAVPDSFATIASALSVAGSGDTVLVDPGSYPEHLTLVDGVVLRGDPADRPVIDGTDSGVPLTASSCGAGTIVENFVITNGSGAIGGGAFFSWSSVAVTNCRFVDNAASHGGGAAASACAGSFTGCEFENNTVTQTGGGLSVMDLPSPIVTGCSFVGNTANAGAGLAVRNGCQPTVSGCLFDGNQAGQGGGIWYDFFAGGSLTTSTIVWNSADDGGGLFLTSLANPVVETCVVAFGSAGEGVMGLAGAEASMDCCNVFGNAGGDSLIGVDDLGTNLSLDPLFCNAGSGIYTLQDLSPCLPGGPCGLIGAFGLGGCPSVAVGAGVEITSWASVKSRYR